MVKNANRKRLKHLELLKQLKEKYKQVKFVNLSLGAFGLCDKSPSDFTDMMKNLHMDTAQTSFIIRKIINVAIRNSYYVFCCRNKQWYNPELMRY